VAWFPLHTYFLKLASHNQFFPLSLIPRILSSEQHFSPQNYNRNGSGLKMSGSGQGQAFYVLGCLFSTFRLMVGLLLIKLKSHARGPSPKPRSTWAWAFGLSSKILIPKFGLGPGSDPALNSIKMVTSNKSYW
jgi:hypothetical protein